MTRSRGAKAPSQRQLRVGEELRHVMARLLNAGEAHDPDLAGASITVSEVRVSPDLKNATVFVLPLAGRQEASVLAALKRAAPFFRHRLAEEMTLRFTPRLSFQLDHSFEEADRIERLLHSERVRQDLAAEGEAEQAEDDDGED
ncbi:ribosome-binding factor A [Tistlia consotensis]|uniref:Ribosome-binding factor A n=1 Tax=Tistlia consotensis USBA 355 TaxID=560819 RepID=A0A1Y6CRS9_9PROT|nr:30S ribosome-binding factor RbfA [Tistlia consotensis]SMF74559.1 ribosome-binding factor A [Tistlia consotensis USBA 355]SNS10863.1 ribosome-binding factor A [Tistlia consotensis]